MERRRSRFRALVKAIAGTIAAIVSGVYLTAIWHQQAPVMPVSQPAIEAMHDGHHYVLTRAYSRMVRGHAITVLPGFVFDGASIPDRLESVYALTSISPSLLAGALLHDALYASELLPRTEADEIFYAVILADGTEQHKAAAAYRAVSDCGELVWSRHTDESVDRARQYVSVE